MAKQAIPEFSSKAIPEFSTNFSFFLNLFWYPTCFENEENNPYLDPKSDNNVWNEKIEKI